MDAASLFVLSPELGLKAIAAQDKTGFVSAFMPVFSQLVALNEPYDESFADSSVQDLALLTTVPSLGAALFGAAPKGALDGLAQLLTSVQDPAQEALFEGQPDPLAIANPVDFVMAYVREGNFKRLPH